VRLRGEFPDSLIDAVKKSGGETKQNPAVESPETIRCHWPFRVKPEWPKVVMAFRENSTAVL
jgi:hypothetical protein